MLEMCVFNLPLVDARRVHNAQAMTTDPLQHRRLIKHVDKSDVLR